MARAVIRERATHRCAVLCMNVLRSIDMHFPSGCRVLSACRRGSRRAAASYNSLVVHTSNDTRGTDAAEAHSQEEGTHAGAQRPMPVTYSQYTY
jgi:hypothetical protein